MDMFFQKLQMFCFEVGSTKESFVWERIGNKIQDFRDKFTIKYAKGAK